MRILDVWLLLTFLLLAAARPAARFATDSDDARQRARLLQQELACTACHAAPGVAFESRAPRLELVGARRTLDYLAELIAAPHTAKPGTSMPDLLHGDEEQALDLAHYLVSLSPEPLESAPETLSWSDVESGRQLYHGVGCAACHEPLEEAWALDAPVWDYPDALAPSGREHALGYAPGLSDDPLGRSVPLGRFRGATTIEATAAFLNDPLSVRPAGRMPSAQLEVDEARAIAAYLHFEDALATGITSAAAPGLSYRYYEGAIAGDGRGMDELTPVRSGVAAGLNELPEHREDRFGFRWSGFLEVVQAGRYSLHLTSDDGSWCSIDSKQVVDNGGDHPMLERSAELWLDAGRHSIEIGFRENTGDQGLVVEWTRPDGRREALPSAALSHVALALPRGTTSTPAAARTSVDPTRVARGRALFGRVGCVACHASPEAVAASPQRPAPPLTDAPGAIGCLGPEPSAGLPRYLLSDADRQLLASAPAPDASADRAASSAQHLDDEFTRLRCSACHTTAAAAGPSEARRPYFRVDTDAELGDEGRLPPSLRGVASKLRPEWLAQVLREGAGVRPYMQTRMPRFGAGNVEPLLELLESSAPESADAPSQADPNAGYAARISAGRQLVGTSGLGCIQCHDLAGHPSLGIPAVDLSSVTERIRPHWFEQLLNDPSSVNMNTRMPSFWSAGKSPLVDILDGNPARQTAAIWAYLELGEDMPLPPGLSPDGESYELVIDATAVLCGVFYAGASPRTILVGHPELVHYAYDVQHSRPVHAWRGRFFNAAGTWHGRAGGLERAPSDDALRFPPGPAIAPFDLGALDDVPWPAQDAVLPRVLGRRFDAERRPTFRYGIAEAEVEESLIPLSTSAGLVRRIAVQDGRSLVLRVATSERFERRREAYIDSEGVRYTCGEATVRRVPGGEELLLALPANGTVEVEVRW